MKGAENQVAGHGGLNGNLSRFEISNFSNEYHIGIVSQDRTKPSSEVEPNFMIDLNLADAGHLIFNRILDGNDLDVFSLNLVEAL